MDRIISHIQHVLAPAQGWSMARSARWVRVWGWRRRKLGLDLTAGQIRARAANIRMGRHVVDSESATFTQVVEQEAGVPYKTAQRWVRWGSLGAIRLKGLEGTPEDDLRHLDTLCSNLAAAGRQSGAPAIVGTWRRVEDRFYVPEFELDIRLGDCQAQLRSFEPESIDSIITDQPYGVAYRDRAGRGIEGDADPEGVASWFAPAAARVLRRDAWCVLHGPSFKRLPNGQRVDFVWDGHMTNAGVPIVGVAAWDKCSPGLGTPLMHQHEQVWVCRKGNPLIWRGGESDVWRVPRSADAEHPTPKPPELHIPQFQVFSAPEGLVLDPFCGTGATAVAAIRTGRRYIGIEIDEGWYREAVERVRLELERPMLLAA
ncbi:MAG TPA: DNA methyltransferase [Devosia sp.]|jgi:DNA modification methylase|uniref:DNA-methyltransferase n=1 Tax=Devosia sp. TaxID=1871048 RepID=UPI002DDCAA86|nr:DNA methyltransferase [Devosia sp.]HEV2517156.1 DNA methyltransferase [Devosia sp.]